MVSFRDAVNQLFQDSFIRPGVWLTPFDGSQLAVDLIENKDEVIVKASVPGIKPDDLDITVTGDQLTVKGETKSEEKIEEANYVRKERRYGAFSRSFSLPQTVDAGKVSAEYKHGVLTVRLPLREEAKPRQIRVEVAA